MLLKINKADMTGTMEAIKENLRSCNGFVRAPLAYDIREKIIVKTYDDYPKYVNPDNKMIARMLSTSRKKSFLSIIFNRSVYDIPDQICKDTDLYSYIKQHESKSNGRGAFYAIHSR